MELLPESIRKQLPPLYSQEGQEDPLVYVKFFHPLSTWTWYGIEFDGTDIFYGWVNGDFPELGYFSLSELASVDVMEVKIERDVHFEPMRLSEVKALHQSQDDDNGGITVILID